MAIVDLKSRLLTTTVAFRGYNTTNLGRSAECLAHPLYGPIVARWLKEASEHVAEATSQKVDLVERVRAGRESTIESFAEDIGLIMGMELAQLEILRTCFGVEYERVRSSFGYSLGEITALVASGVYDLGSVLRPLAALAGDCAELSHDVTMGVVFSRGPALDFEGVDRLCLQITTEAKGVIAVSSRLGPNAALVLGQGTTVDRFKDRVSEELSAPVHVRKNSGRWPPLHTPLLWQKNVPNRAGLLMQNMPGGFKTPRPTIVSLVTGKASYNDYNSRELMMRWLDHPLFLWDAIYELLSGGVEVVIHVGPGPNLVPATFKRLADNVRGQFGATRFSELELQALGGMARRPWLQRVLPARVALLRAPFVQHVVLEDWLLEMKPA
ncbi:MAG: ACP S-malonyltransferase [Planctomycetes bacterium]|nr:ACP S-malonyltransferase [Planctomycetota bacterium]